ncbi:hypothetical protein PAEVO_65620 [Paenibacillus sp. GM2FR]|nr:hypothetical protein PAEVO_65620 [Paenibacillus sp. GM2FR]
MYQPSGEDGIVLKKRQRSPLKPGNDHDSNSSFLVLTAIVRTIRQQCGHVWFTCMYFDKLQQK